jgi:hypothetical protein
VWWGEAEAEAEGAWRHCLTDLGLYIRKAGCTGLNMEGGEGGEGKGGGAASCSGAV